MIFPSGTTWLRLRVEGIMASASASLCAVYPDMAQTISTMASVRETVAGITGIYITMFLAIPLCDKLYRLPEPRLGKFALKSGKGGGES